MLRSKANGKLDLDKVRELQLTQKQDEGVRPLLFCLGVLSLADQARETSLP